MVEGFCIAADNSLTSSSTVAKLSVTAPAPTLVPPNAFLSLSQSQSRSFSSGLDWPGTLKTPLS